MNEGIIFLWIAWFFWTYATFLLPKSHPFRFGISFHCLVLIILSTYFIKIDYININVAIIYLFFLAIWLMRKCSLKTIIYSFLTIILYSSVKIFYLMDPVLFHYKETLFLIILSYIMCFILFSNFKERVGSLLLMIGLGEWVFAYIITYYFQTTYTIGLEILDSYFITIFFLVVTKAFFSIINDWKNMYYPLHQLKKKQL